MEAAAGNANLELDYNLREVTYLGWWRGGGHELITCLSDPDNQPLYE